MKRYEYVSTGTGGGHMFHEDGSLGQFGEYVLADDAEAEMAEMRAFYTETIQEQAADYLEAVNLYEEKLREERQAVADAHDCRNARYIGLHDTIAELEAALLRVKDQALAINDIEWGHDGDCGADRIADEIIDIVDAALKEDTCTTKSE